MTARHDARRRVVAAVAALVAAAGLAVYPLGGTPPANAVTDPISGFGSTSSAVTLKWADGITGADTSTASIAFAVSGVAAGAYLAYASVDGAESPLTQATGQFDEPRVVVTP